MSVVSVCKISVVKEARNRNDYNDKINDDSDDDSEQSSSTMCVASLARSLYFSDQPMACASNDARYGPKASLKERWPACESKGELWSLIDTSYPKEKRMEAILWAERRKTHLWTSVELAQRKYAKRVVLESYDPESRGLLIGIEGSTLDETLLLGGKQLALAIYRAADDQPDCPNVQAALRGGYWVQMRPKNSLATSSRPSLNTGMQTIAACSTRCQERVLHVQKVLVGFKEFLDAKHQTNNGLPAKGDYSYHNQLAAWIKNNASEHYPTFQLYKDSKMIMRSLEKFPELNSEKNCTASDSCAQVDAFVKFN